MLRALCLDLMGTVLYDPYLEAIAAGTGRPATPGGLADPSSWRDFEMARIDEAEFLRRCWPDAGGRPFDAAAFHAARRDGYRFLPGMRELLHAVGGRLDRYIASNYPVWIEEVRLAFALDECCEGVWASHHLGVRKPDPEFYLRLLARIGHRAESCLFVDDRASNCAGAEAVGMRAHLFDGAEGLARRLRVGP